MQYNYWLARKHFDEAWDKLRIEYVDAGMSEIDIEEMYQYDLADFRKERTYLIHNMPVQPKYIQARTGTPDQPVFEKRYSIALSVSDQPFEQRFATIPDASDNPKMRAMFQQMDSVDYTVLLLLDAGYLQEEIAAQLGVSQPAVSRRIKKIKKFLE